MLKRALIIMMLTIPITGCDVDQNAGILMAAGSYGDLAVVVSSEELRPVAARFLADFVQTKIFVIKDEPDFKADIYLPDRWDLAKGYKNVLFITRLGDGGKAEKAVRGLVSKESLGRLAAGGGGIVQLNDPWSTYQLAVVVASRDRNSLSSLLRNNSDRLRGIFNDSSRERILRHNRYEGLQTDLMNDYWQRFGFVLEIPRDFTQNQLQPDGYPGLELMRPAPSRGISVTWTAAEDPVALLQDDEALTSLRADLGRRLHDEDIVPQTLVWSDAQIDGNTARKLEGAWTSNRFEGGGAFWCYFVPDPERKRIFCVDLLAYAPGMNKMNFFRQLDAVASTFSLSQPRP